jgi:hypothetical protein
VQWGLRLLITEGSRLRELDDLHPCLDAFDPQTLTYRWRHADPHVDRLQSSIMRRVGVELGRSRRDVFGMVCAMAGLTAPDVQPAAPRATIPFLNEPWYC